MKRSQKWLEFIDPDHPKPRHRCGGFYERIENAMFPLPYGRPQFRCKMCHETWTEGHDGGDSLRLLEASQKDRT